MALGPIDVCGMAIVAFWRAFYRYMKYPFNETKARTKAFDDSPYLLEDGDKGLRYGAPGWPHLKLCFTKEKGFYLDSNGMGDEFLAFQSMVAEEFEAAGLTLHIMPC